MITDRRWLCAVPLLLALGLAGCDEPPGDDHGHEHSAEGAHDEDEHGHGDEGEALVYTDYTRSTELFVEFPPLVAGESSTFAAHVSRLDDGSPLKQGTLDIVLQQGGTAVARFRVREPARTGIFTPAVTPRDAGEFQLLVEVAADDLRVTHDLGTVTVFPSRTDVVVDQSAPEGDIAYLKEQQWGNPFRTTEVAGRSLRPSVPGFATVQAPADASAEVRAPTDGYFAQELAAAGETVEAGAVLGYMVPRLGDTTDVGQLVVALERARSALSLARRDVERLEGLVAEGAVAERRLLEAREELAVARAEHETARARLQQYEQGSEKAGIALRSPVAGEVVEVTARPGAFVRAGDRVFRIAAPDRRWLDVQVPERFAARLQDTSGAWFDSVGGESVVLDAGRGARVIQAGTAIDPVTRTARVIVEYPAEIGPTLIGSRLPAHVFTTAPQTRTAVPRSAVIDDGGRRVVYVQTAGETFARRPVELGIVDGTFVEVLAGVEAGERVVSTGAYFVKLASVGGEEVGHGHAH